jgi:hypothetical protein
MIDRVRVSALVALLSGASLIAAATAPDAPVADPPCTPRPRVATTKSSSI